MTNLTTSTERRVASSLIYLLFMLSGVAALVHETTWLRLLRLVLGNTPWALSVVLGVFLGGLALGAYLGGRYLARRADPLRVFALLEGITGLYCLALPWLLPAITPLYRAWYQHGGAALTEIGVAQFAVSALLLSLPAIAMGATLPLLVRHFDPQADRIGAVAGRLYAVNSAGAVIGALGAGFVLLPYLGLISTVVSAAAINLLIAGVAWRQGGQIPVTAQAQRTTETRAEHDTDNWRRLVLWGYGLSGLAALVYEVAWTRVLTLYLGSSVYAFSLILAVFILGLSAGSAVVSRRVARIKRPGILLAWCQFGIAFGALAVVPLMSEMPVWSTQWFVFTRESFAATQLLSLVIAGALMLLPTLLMGASFPLANQVLGASNATAPSVVGRVYAVNTVGSVGGALLAGLWLLPSLGTQHTILVAVMINVATGAAWLALAPGAAPLRRTVNAAVAMLLISAIVVLLPRWDPARMDLSPLTRVAGTAASGTAVRAQAEKFLRERPVIFHRDDAIATVSVRQTPGGARVLYLNGKAEASGGRLAHLLAHVPVLLHPRPQHYLQIGLASGITLGAAAKHPLRSLDVVELSPGVIDATPLFARQNGNVMEDKRVRVIRGDGRNYLTLSDTQYDVIVSQPSHAWIAGTGDLFTVEFFRALKKRLAPDGVAAVWLDGRHLDEQTFRSVVASFRKVFVRSSLWKESSPDYLLVGFNTRTNLRLDLMRLDERMRVPEMQKALAALRIGSAEHLFGEMVTGPAGVARLARAARLHTDDNALVEFATPRNLLRNPQQEQVLALVEQQRIPELSFITGADKARVTQARQRVKQLTLARGKAYQAQQLFYKGELDAAVEKVLEAHRLNPNEPRIRNLLSNLNTKAALAAKEGRNQEAIELLQQILKLRSTHVGARIGLNRLLNKLGDRKSAQQHISVLEQQAAKNPRLAMELGLLHEREQRWQEAIGFYRAALRNQPRFTSALAGVARVLINDPSQISGKQEALRLMERANDRAGGRDPRILEVLADVYASLGRTDDVRRTLDQAVVQARAGGNQQLIARLEARAAKLN